MRQHTLTICESRPIGTLHWVAFEATNIAANWQPGQYLQLLCDDPQRPQRQLLRSSFPAIVDAKLGRIGLVIAPLSDDGWRWLAQQAVGSSVWCHGPHGKLPQPLSDRGTALCIGQAEGTIRLIGMVNALQQRHTSVTLIAGDMTPNWYVPPQLLPTDVEYLAGPENILRVAEKRLPELIRWADQIFIAASAPMATTLVQMIRQIRLRGGKYVATAMPTTPLPCASMACQQCRVQTRHGPRLACQIGPWFGVHLL
jgi:hypothetical protein